MAFRTRVSNSHGTPHVLEHSVLSGSEHYPVKVSNPRDLNTGALALVAFPWERAAGQ